MAPSLPSSAACLTPDSPLTSQTLIARALVEAAAAAERTTAFEGAATSVDRIAAVERDGAVEGTAAAAVCVCGVLVDEDTVTFPAAAEDREAPRGEAWAASVDKWEPGEEETAIIVAAATLTTVTWFTAGVDEEPGGVDEERPAEAKTEPWPPLPMHLRGARDSNEALQEAMSCRHGEHHQTGRRPDDQSEGGTLIGISRSAAISRSLMPSFAPSSCFSPLSETREGRSSECECSRRWASTKQSPSMLSCIVAIRKLDYAGERF